MPTLSSCGGDDSQAAGAGGAQVGAVKDYPVITIAPMTTTLYSEFPATIEGQQNVEIRPKIDGYRHYFATVDYRWHRPQF